MQRCGPAVMGAAREYSHDELEGMSIPLVPGGGISSFVALLVLSRSWSSLFSGSTTRI